jgi:hypothetical protein
MVGCRMKSAFVAGLTVLSGMVSTVGAATSYQGYTFFASGATAHLYDMNGKSVHTWKSGGNAQTCAYLLPDGSALFPIQNSACTSPQHNGAFPSGRFQKIGWDGAILWDYKFCDATARAGYDVEPMPNGNILAPCDASGVAKIVEIKPTGATTGEVVWQYTLPSDLSSGNTYCNSVSYNPALDMILIDMQESVRKLVVIDHRGAGSVVYTYSIGASGRVHAADWVLKSFVGTDIVMPDADTAAMRINNLLVVYNGGDQVVEVDLTTKTKVKSIAYTFSDHEGSAQRLPNGNTLVTPGGSRTITELDDTGARIGTMSAPGTISRAYRYGPTYPGLANLLPAAIAGRTASSAPECLFHYTKSCVTIAQSHSSPMDVRIFTAAGKTVYAARSQRATAVIPTGNLLTGVYFVDIRYASGSLRTSFVNAR